LNLILAHGYLGFRSILGFQYFNGVQRYLADRYPVRIVETQVNPLQSVAFRGTQLRRQMLVALGETPPATDEERQIAGQLDPAKPVHLIAHSMGSLDCRFLISPGNPDNLGDRVTTLTTIGGPHRGTPVADLLYSEAEGQDLPPAEKALARYLRRVFAVLGISLEGLADMRTSFAAGFNAQYVDHPGVRYFSVAGGGRAEGLPVAKLMYRNWLYIKEKTGEVNDGAVPVSSAQWGEFNPDLWMGDHPELIGHDVNRCGEGPKDFDWLAKYGQLVEQLLKLEA
jgi:triacylglycerol lipase